MNIQYNFQNYSKNIYTFLDEFLRKKAKEAKKTAPETFYFINAAKRFILSDKNIGRKSFLTYSVSRKLDEIKNDDFLDIFPCLALEQKADLIFNLTNWKKENLFIKEVLKKYEKDKTKKDPLHIAFSQSLILGDIVLGFCYEIILNSDFSNERKIEFFRELNNIIKQRQIEKLNEN